MIQSCSLAIQTCRCVCLSQIHSTNNFITFTCSILNRHLHVNVKLNIVIPFYDYLYKEHYVCYIPKTN